MVNPRSDLRFREYYNKGSYRKFKKVRGHKNKISQTTHYVFSNGSRNIFASGLFEEEALIKIFDKIDQYYSG